MNNKFFDKIEFQKKIKGRIENLKKISLAKQIGSFLKERPQPWLDLSKICIYLIVFLLPLWFLLNTTNVLDFNKQILLIFFTIIALLSFLFNSLKEKKLTLNLNFFNFTIIGFLIILGISTLFSFYQYGSFWGWPLNIESSFLTYLCFIILYFLIINTFQKKEIPKLVFTLIISVFLITLFSLFQLFGKFLLPFNFTKIISFNPIGSLNSLTIFTVILLPISIILSFLNKKLIKIFLWIIIGLMLFLVLLINFWVGWIILLISSILIFGFGMSKQEVFSEKWLFLPILCLILALMFGITKLSFPDLPIFSSEPLLSYKMSFDITIKSLKDSYSSFFIGSGPSTFVYNYSKFKPIEINQTDFWLEKFTASHSEILNILTTTGILGLLSFLSILIFCGYLGFKEIQKKIEQNQKFEWLFKLGLGASWLSSVIAFFLYPLNLTLNFVFWFLTALIILSISNHLKTFHFGSSPLQILSFSFIFVLIFVLGINFLFLTSQIYFAEIKYSQGLKAFQAGDKEKALSLIEQAVEYIKRKNDLYLRDLSQIYLLKVNEQIQKQDFSFEQTVQKIMPLINNLLDLTKKAVEIAPKNGTNWIIRGVAYRNILGFTSNEAIDWAEKAYQKAIELEPTNPYFYYEKGLLFSTKFDLLFQQEKKEEKNKSLKFASKCFQKALDLKPDYTPARFQIILLLVKEGKNEEAIEKLELLKRDLPFDPLLAYQLGLVYYNLNRFEKAKVEFQRAINLSSIYSNARYFLGLIYIREGNKSAALEQFEEIEKFNPENLELKKLLEDLRKDNLNKESVKPLPLEIPAEVNKKAED